MFNQLDKPQAGETIAIMKTNHGTMKLRLFEERVGECATNFIELAKQGKETAATYTQAGRQDLADAELAQVEVLESYLPKQLSQEEIEAEVKKIIAEVGATSMKDMGKVMGTASKQLAGKADGRVISEIVKKLLA